eukprot:252291-Pelagomonas_calceolata.AAC.1
MAKSCLLRYGVCKSTRWKNTHVSSSIGRVTPECDKRDQGVLDDENHAVSLCSCVPMSSCLRLSGHNRVETQGHHGNRCSYELRICNKCDWHTKQDKEHIILDS